MRELLARLEELLAQTDASHREVRDIMETLEATDTVTQAMQSFIESGYRDEFEETLSFEEQEQYRAVFELDSNETFGSLFPDDEESAYSRDA